MLSVSNNVLFNCNLMNKRKNFLILCGSRKLISVIYLDELNRKSITTANIGRANLDDDLLQS